ncbi:MAG TPA: hypothetical protein VF831_00680, partial [Anaerolineales bacterium]
AFGVMIGGMFSAASLPQVGYILPLSMDKISLMVALGQPLPAADVSQVISAAVLSIVFTLVALWRFQHKEF